MYFPKLPAETEFKNMQFLSSEVISGNKKSGLIYNEAV